MKTKQDTSGNQIQFGSLDDQIATDNPVRISDAFVEKLNVKKLGIKRKHKLQSRIDVGGAPRYDDRMLLKLYLYGYLNRICNSRKLEQECSKNMELRWLMGQLVPTIIR